MSLNDTLESERIKELFKKSANSYANYRQTARSQTDEGYCGGGGGFWASTWNLLSEDTGYFHEVCDMMTEDDEFPFLYGRTDDPHIVVAPWNIDIWAEYCHMVADPGTTRPHVRCGGKLDELLRDRHAQLERIIGPKPEIQSGVEWVLNTAAAAFGQSYDDGEVDQSTWTESVWQSLSSLWAEDPDTAGWIEKALIATADGKIGRVAVPEEQQQSGGGLPQWYQNLTPQQQQQIRAAYRRYVIYAQAQG